MQYRPILAEWEADRYSETAPGRGISLRLGLQNVRQGRFGQAEVGTKLALTLVLDLHRLDVLLPRLVQLPVQAGELAVGTHLDHGLYDRADAGHYDGRHQG
ncbi:MAG: hypothetical protein OXF79_01255 [Chloroflexi bacterium]|nr:hypothetical protein [Chloroflexota bacterium]